jgi:hypothetical protein
LLKVALNTINKQTSSLTEQNKRPWRDVGNPVSGLGQAQRCGGVKSVNGIKCINGLKKEYYKKSETYGWNLDWIFFFLDFSRNVGMTWIYIVFWTLKFIWLLLSNQFLLLWPVQFKVKKKCRSVLAVIHKLI